MNELPIYKIRNKFYFRDVRLNEYRNIKDINDTIPLDNVGTDDFQTPTKEDIAEIWGYENKRFK